MILLIIKILKIIGTIIVAVIMAFIVDLFAVAFCCDVTLSDVYNATCVIEHYTEKYDTEEIEIEKLIEMSPDTELFERFGIHNKKAILRKSDIINRIDRCRENFWIAFIISSVVCLVITIISICVVISNFIID